MNQRNISGGFIHDLPVDLHTALAADPNVLAAWEDITPLARNEWICWATMVKKQETRAQHVARVVSELKQGIRRPCCWPGCPHRNANAKKWFAPKKRAR
ncbi:YdeI/OmpD-associated family protein [Candidatus Uhrbacteria bacterium]|nr:YdeI/OmpD-associated family protein [Candidatus Uhrbacteria bacterium]